ncbi:MAG: hypothetical protein LBS03_07060 [Bacteroidales bacterium]|jgi:hypothetical protein|nr:hypothetical protein [Bacteroidales bacterium]
MKKLIIVIVNILLLNSCEYFAETSYGIGIKNNSNQIIYAYADYILPDTVLSVERPKYLIEVPFGEKYSTLIYDRYVNDPKFARLEAGERITVFILCKDSVDMLPWAHLRIHNIILKRYEFNDEELMAVGNGYDIYYPYKK